MVQRNFVKMKSNPIGKGVATLIAVIAGVVLFVSSPLLIILLGLFGTAMLWLLFPILGYLPILTVLLLTFVGLGTIMVWAIYKKDLKPVLLPCLVLILPVLAATILIMFSPHVKFLLNYFFFLPFLIIMLSIFTGLGAIVINPSYRQDLRRVLKLIVITLGAMALSTFLWLGLYLGPMWAALYLMPYWVLFSSIPRIFTFLIAGLIVTYLYWPNKKRGLFLTILGSVFLLELLSFLTINLIIGIA